MVFGLPIHSRAGWLGRLRQGGADPVALDLLTREPGEIAAVLDCFAPAERQAVLAALPGSLAAQALVLLDPASRADVLGALPPAQIAGLLAMLPVQYSAALLAQLPPPVAGLVLQDLPDRVAEELRCAKHFAPNRVGRVMIPNIPRVSADAPVSEALAKLRNGALDPRTLDHLYVVDQAGRLVGVLALCEVLGVDPGTTAGELVAGRPVVSIPAFASLAEAVRLLRLEGKPSVPVVDSDGRLLGIAEIKSLLRCSLLACEQRAMPAAPEPAADPVRGGSPLGRLWERLGGLLRR